jgi:single-strand DNA-binding protein
MSVNKVIVIGNLGANPDIRALPSGQNVANFSLATTERFTDRNGAKQERSDWHRIVAFGPLADTCDRFLSKGRQVYVEGRLTTRQYKAKDGSGKRDRTEIVARQLRLLGNRMNGNTSKAEASDDVPFSSSPRRESRENRFFLNHQNRNRRLRRWTYTR